MIVRYRRRREQKTNYRKRLKLLLSRLPRFVVRRKPNQIICQLIEYHPDGDRVIASANSLELKHFGWKGHTGNLPAAYLTGFLCAKRAKVKKAILDIGLQRSTKGNAVYAALKGAVDGGLEIPHSDEILPDESRIKGEHIANYAKQLEKEKYQKQFSAYLKKGLKPEEIVKHFEEVKAAIEAKVNG